MILLAILLINSKPTKKQALSFIPEEFNDLKEKALSSARKRINQINNNEKVIIPNKPYIKDEFIGFVNYALFAHTVSDLKGFAMTDEKSHIAIIVNRSTRDGIEMMKEKSMFADQKTNAVYSLFFKYADDGEVAIYNISKINEYQIFDRFQLTLPMSSLNSKCSYTGKNFGARCSLETEFNWDINSDLPKSQVLEPLNVKLFYGMRSRAEASIVIKKSGAFNIQVEMDSSFDFEGCLGFKIPKINTSSSNFKEIEELTQEIANSTFYILTIPFTLKVLLVFQPKLENLGAVISKDISLFKVFKLHLRKSLIVSTRHQKTSQTEKDFHIETILENGEIDDDEEFKTEAKIYGSISIKSGLRVELHIGHGSSYFSIEGGAKPTFDFEFIRNTTQCTAPAMYGTFKPTIFVYIEGKGEIKIASIKIFKSSKEKKWKILSLEGNLGSCMYNDEYSRELDEDLQEKENKELNILLYNNFDALNDGIYSIGNNLSNYDRFYNKYLYLERESHIFHPNQSFIITNTNYNYTNLKSHVRYNDSIEYSNHTELLDLSDNFSYNANLLMKDNFLKFSIFANKSRQVSYGREFIMKNEEYINSRPRGISEFPFNLGLIYKVNKSYHAHYDDYFVINEYEDSLHDDNHNQNDVYQTTDYSSFNIIIELNDLNDDKHCLNRTALKVFHIQEENEHLLYVTFFERNNSQINESFDSSLIYVPLTESKGNINCTRIEFDECSFNLTRNDMIRPNNIIVKKTEFYTFTINVTYPNYPDYIFKLNKPKVTLENHTIQGIVARIFQFRNKKIVPFDEVPQIISFRMGKNELYGIYRGLFQSHGENLSNIYALMHMPKIQPLTNDANLLESDSYFIKLIENTTIFKRNPNDPNDSFYDIIIPFRRRNQKVDDLEITLKMIFQAEESSNDDPFCSPFSKFSIKPNKKIFAGCIHSFSTNSWEHFTSFDEDIIREQEISIPDSRYKLHCINLKNIPEEKTNEITVYATSKYIEFPLTSRFIIIENETAAFLKSYCFGEYLQVICHRCDKIMIEKDGYTAELIKSPHFEDIFMIMIDESFNSSFPLIAYCDLNSSSFCTFEINITNDGYVLVEYNEKYPTNYGYENDQLPDDSPGVEEIYPLSIFYNNSNQVEDNYDLICTDQTRLDSGFKRQILHRNEIIYATKSWSRGIEKLLVRIEEKPNFCLLLTYNRYFFPNFLELSLHYNSELSRSYDIPFSGKVFYESLNTTNNYPFLQIGISINFTDNEINSSIYMNSDGHIIVRKNIFNAKKIKDIPKGSKFELIDLPEGCYSIKLGGSTDPVDLPLWYIILISILIGIVFIGIPLSIIVIRIINWREKMKLEKQNSSETTLTQQII